MKKVIEKIVDIFIMLPFVKGKFNENCYRTIELYKDSSFDYIFSKIRFWDGPFLEIERATPKSGVIIDLGCGEGILTNFLAISSPERKLIGVDIDESRIKRADRGLRNTIFVKGDVIKYKLPECDCIVLSHVFHHLLSYNDQQILVDRISKRLEKGDKLIIAEVDRGMTAKYVLSWLVDSFVFPILFENKIMNLNSYHRSRKGWIKLLKKNGFKLRVKKGLPGRPFPDIIIQALKE
jgi:SAM-dependent methyltransferase